ncbi:diaminopimelate epimerase [Lysobacter sp. TY2-98]|uniref:diaminopimelate epimerase n=1 Tax=Lysobacter sp. TY2-98 TaxID=2290922 RepID=UPI000E204DDE|nr:diaminopimelate epimerase [Lysobacter sp. TY2-98]AXK73442.1 diaminopimelate epimerase [Lysobacter sp. TY2-98]
MRFTKMHGAGNDFVVLDLRDGRDAPSPALCRALADRHSGVGCDQILTIERADDVSVVARYGIFNADGSRAGQCGNGARCVAAWLRRDAASRGTLLPERFDVTSPAGRHAVEFVGDDRVRLDMGQPRFAPADVPLAGFDAADEYALHIDGRDVHFSAASMGNPHAVIRVDDVDTAPVDTLGPALQRDDAFPDSVNVGFVQVVDRSHLRLRVYERGVGETLACGSGACAAAVTAMRRGWVERAVDVALPGGTLRIEWPSDDASVAMTGPTAFVFEGDWLE